MLSSIGAVAAEIALSSQSGDNVPAQLYTPHAPIQIDSEAEFHSIAAAESWPGNGNESSPYIISGFSFAAAEHMFRVVDSEIHFIFSNNRLDGLAHVWCGIAIMNSSNGRVIGNSITRAAVAIHVVSVENMFICDNEADDSHFAGIVVEDGSNNVTVKNNIVHHNLDDGIFIGNPYGSQPSTNIKILDNVVYENVGNGIELLEADNCTVINNSIHHHTSYGVFSELGSHTVSNNSIHHCHGGVMIDTGNCTMEYNHIYLNRYGIMSRTESNTIHANLIEHNNRSGLRLFYSSFGGSECRDNAITNNTFANNTDWGVDLGDGTQENTITQNNFLDNGNQARDEGTDNVFEMNYWDTWTAPDDNSDGYVDVPFAINGTVANTDPLPLAEPLGNLPLWYITTSATTQTTVSGTPDILTMLLLGGGGAIIVIGVVFILARRK